MFSVLSFNPPGLRQRGKQGLCWPAFRGPLLLYEVFLSTSVCYGLILLYYVGNIGRTSSLLLFSKSICFIVGCDFRLACSVYMEETDWPVSENSRNAIKKVSLLFYRIPTPNCPLFVYIINLVCSVKDMLNSTVVLIR